MDLDLGLCARAKLFNILTRAANIRLTLIKVLDKITALFGSKAAVSNIMVRQLFQLYHLIVVLVIGHCSDTLKSNFIC